MIEYRPLKIALLGAGSVGSQVARLILENRDELAARVGAELQLAGVLVRDKRAARATNIPADLITTEPDALILGADIVIEVMGGIEPARTLILQALNSGSDVITANKALLATHGSELFDVAEQVGAQLYFEAAVAGAIPIIRPLRESLAGDKIKRIMGIVNGSTNYILDRMDTTGISLEQAMAEATKLGYLEADPSLDVEGYDAAQKAAILASLAFHTEVPLEKVYREGITKITSEQMAAAKRDGYVIKLLAICESIAADSEHSDEGISVRVYPAMIPLEHPLASVRGAFNAVFVEAEAAGSLMFYGAGAGGVQTASAVMGDLVSAAKRHVAGGPGLADSVHADLEVLPISRIQTRYQITLEVTDQPGVLAQVANIFAHHNVSIETVEQSAKMIEAETTAWLEIGTHQASDKALAAVVAELESSAAVEQITSVIRVEGV
ncbi:MAG: homoserine dehydrogenase [Micrococcales bacterium]|nr:homoserine dehydrogenase [Actinomycetota bacterium]NCA07365.1 homoserine dehydrogenase [Micrococcales bacterium]